MSGDLLFNPGLVRTSARPRSSRRRCLKRALNIGSSATTAGRLVRSLALHLHSGEGVSCEVAVSARPQSRSAHAGVRDWRLTFCFLQSTQAMTERVFASTAAALSAVDESGTGECDRLFAEDEGESVALGCDGGA